MIIVFYIALMVVGYAIASFIGGAFKLLADLIPQRKLKPVPIKAREYVKPLPKQWWED